MIFDGHITFADILAITPEDISSMTKVELQSLLKYGGRRASSALGSTLKSIPKDELPAWLQDTDTAKGHKTWQEKPWKYNKNTKIGTLRRKAREMQRFVASARRTKGGIEEEWERFKAAYKQRFDKEFKYSVLDTNVSRKKFFDLYKRLSEDHKDVISDKSRGSWQVMRAMLEVWDDSDGDVQALFDNAAAWLEGKYEETQKRTAPVGMDTSDWF